MRFFRPREFFSIREFFRAREFVSPREFFSPSEFFQASDVVRAGWQDFKRHYGILLAAIFVAVLLTLIAVIPLTILYLMAPDVGLRGVLYAVRTIVAIVLIAFFVLGFITIATKIALGDTPSIIDLFSSFMNVKAFFWVVVLVTLAVILGLLVLIVPGIIVALQTCLAPWFVADRNMSATESILSSYHATKGSCVNLFQFGLIALVLIVIGMIPCGLGLLVVVPVLTLAVAHIYIALEPQIEHLASHYY